MPERTPQRVVGQRWPWRRARRQRRIRAVSRAARRARRGRRRRSRVRMREVVVEEGEEDWDGKTC